MRIQLLLELLCRLTHHVDSIKNAQDEMMLSIKRSMV